MAEALRLQNIATSKKIINIFKRNHVYIQAHYSMKQGGGGGACEAWWGLEVGLPYTNKWPVFVVVTLRSFGNTCL